MPGDLHTCTQCDHAHSFTHHKGLSFQIIELEDSGLPQQGILPAHFSQKNNNKGNPQMFGKDSFHCEMEATFAKCIVAFWTNSWDTFPYLHCPLGKNQLHHPQGSQHKSCCRWWHCCHRHSCIGRQTPRARSHGAGHLKTIWNILSFGNSGSLALWNGTLANFGKIKNYVLNKHTIHFF